MKPFDMRFPKVRNGHWNDSNNCRERMEWVGHQLGVKKLDDWYLISRRKVEKWAGGLLFQHRGSLRSVLAKTFPEHTWIPWKFRRLSPQTKDNLEHFVDWLMEQLAITRLEEWYRVSPKHVERLAPMSIVHRNGGLRGILVKVFPGHSWDVMKLGSTRLAKPSQGLLRRMLQDIFPSLLVLEDFEHEELRFDTGKRMKLDVWLPEAKMAVEYQGHQHYEELHIFGDRQDLKYRDEQKRVACWRNGITLLEVPYWWDNQKESLVATIYKVRPDLVKEPGEGAPIPAQPPNKRYGA